MHTETLYRLGADLVLLVHVAFVGFVVGGLLLILAGWRRHWQWIRNPWFRCAHLAAIGVVVLLSWLDQVCPLTDLEMLLREKAGQAVYPGAFVAHWLEAILYYQAPAWVFMIVYTLFGAGVLITWYRIPPCSLSDRSAPPEK